MADTYGELVCRLCKLRDEMRRTQPGRLALCDVVNTLIYMIIQEKHGQPVTYEQAKEAIWGA